MKQISERVIVSSFKDPYLNAGIEEYLFQRVKKGDPKCFFYRNRRSVVIGRFQTPWVECDVSRLIQDRIPLLRRQSGGGTVWHDSGNLNYSFICHTDDYDIDKNYAILLRACRNLGIDAERTKRNDLYIRGKKFSGSAFRKTKTKILHHGTILIRADLKLLKTYLTGDASGIESKGTESVPASVINLSEVFPALDEKVFIDAVLENKIPFMFNEIDDHEETEIYENAGKYREWEWMFGKTPPFRQTFSFSVKETEITVEFSVRHAHIEEATYRIGNSNGERTKIPALQTIRYKPEDVKTVLDKISGNVPELIKSYLPEAVLPSGSFGDRQWIL